MAPTLLERGLPICDLRRNLILTPHIGHSRHGLFFTIFNCHSIVKPSEKDHDLPGVQTQTIGLAVSIPNHYTILITSIKTENFLRFRVFQKNSSFFKIMQNAAYSGHFFFPSHQMTFCLIKINLFFAGNFSV
jgi:hypothetical protein